MERRNGALVVGFISRKAAELLLSPTKGRHSAHDVVAMTNIQKGWTRISFHSNS